jgi:alkanesulfonate monooxygenase SsuD/methylene tetrahydromethanopterin reductase-like flavin-dependent oxidoreductase (luciferase family)
MLDCLSNGRVEVGVGSGFARHDFEAFGVAESERESRFHEGLAVLRQALSGSSVNFVGDHYRIQGCQLRPTPIQRPNVPIWVAAALSQRSFRLAGSTGCNLMINA